MLAEFAGWMCRGRNPLTPTELETGFYQLDHRVEQIAERLYGERLTDTREKAITDLLPEGVPRYGWAESLEVVQEKLRAKLAEGDEPFIVTLKHLPQENMAQRALFHDDYSGDKPREEIKIKATEVPWITDGVWIFSVWTIKDLVS